MRKYVTTDTQAHLQGGPRHAPIGWLAFFAAVSRALFPEEFAGRGPHDPGKGGSGNKIFGDR